MNNIEQLSNFYSDENLGLDLKLVEYAYTSFKPFFKGSVGLELGPSYGYMTKFLIDDFDSLHIVEGSKSLINQIPSYINIVKHNILFEEFHSEIKFDTIIMNHVLEHLENPQSILTKFREYVSPDGVFIIGVPNAKSIHRLAAVKLELLTSEYALKPRDKKLGHFRVYDTKSLIKEVEHAGLTVNNKGGIFLKPLSNAQIKENWDDELINGFYLLGNDFPDHCAEVFVVCSNSIIK